MSAKEIGHGALVGWSFDSLGDTIAMHIQSVSKPPPHRSEDVRYLTLVLSRNQAVQIGNQMYQITGQTPPVAKRRSWLSRLISD